MNAKNIFRNIRGLAMSALLLIPAAFVSCSDDDTEGGSPYFRLENTVVSSKLVTASSDLGFDAEAIIGDATLELIRYDIRSNCNWSVECNSTDGDWIKFYPKTGQGDGKVRFCLDDNDANTPRSATVVFRYADGRQTETTLVVNQSANEPYIRFVVNNIETNEIVAGRYAAHYDIRVASNVTPFYEPEKAEWATFTETGNGTFTLDIEEYPEQPASLSRDFSIAFKGSGQYKDIRADLNILQDITPQIEITSEDIGDDLALPPFPAYQPNAFTFKVKSNWDWTISVAENAWIEVTPSAGEADKEYVMTVKATSNLSLDERSASFSIISDEVLGTKAVKEIFVTQESLAEGGPLEGLDAPVKWFFNGASGHGLHGSERAVRAEQQAHGLVGRRLYLLLPHLQLRRQPAPQQHAHDRRHGTTLRHGSMEGRLLVIRSSGQELQVGNEGSFYGSHTYLRHRTEVLEPAIYGRYELETGDRHADRNRQRGTDHLHASGTDGQHADRRDNDLRTRYQRRQRQDPVLLRSQHHGRHGTQRRYDPLGKLRR